MNAIVTLTMNPTIDLNTTVEHVIAERKLRCRAPHHEPGGGGINVSRAIRRLGGDSLAIYLEGGTVGRLLKRLLEEGGVRHRAVHIDGMTREDVNVLEEASDRQFRFGMPGPEVREQEWQACLEELFSVRPDPEYLVVSGSLPPGVEDDFYARVARRAKERGIKVLLDSSGKALNLGAEAGVYLLKPNMRELQELAGREIGAESHQEEAAKRLIEKDHCQVIMVSLGAAGALLVTRDGCERLRAPTVPIRSKVGAGDSMVAGTVLALSRGMSIQEAALFGLAAGSAAVQTLGTELCRREDTEMLYERMKSKKIESKKEDG
jgi:6-phosphofructokinase 2